MFEELKKSWQWALGHFWNLFSIVGVIATFYFGLFYIPDYAKENLYSKSELAQEEIIHEIGEQLYAGKDITVEDVKSAIEQKEIFYKMSFPFSTKQTLLLINNDFSKNDYIPLEKRNEVKSKIQNIVNSIEENPAKENTLKYFDYLNIASIFLGKLRLSPQYETMPI